MISLILSMGSEGHEFPADQFFFVVPTLSIWCWFLADFAKKWTAVGRLRVWISSAFRFLSVVLGLIAMVVGLAALLEYYFGLDFGNLLKAAAGYVVWFLRVPLIPTLVVWQVFLILSVVAFAWRVGSRFRRSVGITPDLTPSGDKVTEGPDGGASELAEAETEDFETRNTPPAIRQKHRGVLWENVPDRTPKPVCPRESCNHEMQILSEGPQRKGMILTRQDVGPRNVFLQCSNPGCQTRVPANVTRKQLLSEVQDLFR